MWRKRFARDLFIAHREIVDNRRCDRSGLLQVAFQHVIVGVHVGVRGASAASFHVVAYPLEAWQSDFIERKMIAGAHVGSRYGGSVESFDVVKRVAKECLRSGVVLQEDSANASCAIVEVEVRVELLIFRFELEACVRRLAVYSVDSPSQVRGHVSARSESPLLFRAPKADANRSARLQPERLQDAHHFEHGRCTCCVVGGTRACVPGIDTTADHHHLIFQISARDLGDYVVTHRVVVIEACGYIYFELNGDSARYEPDNAVVLLSGNIDLWCEHWPAKVPCVHALLKRHSGWIRNSRCRDVNRSCVTK